MSNLYKPGMQWIQAGIHLITLLKYTYVRIYVFLTKNKIKPWFIILGKVSSSDFSTEINVITLLDGTYNGNMYK